MAISDRLRQFLTAAWGHAGIRALFVLFVGVACIVATFIYVIETDQQQLSGRYDIYRYFGPLAFYMDYSIHHGEVPLWNPLTYCGMPFAANPQPALFYPPNLLRSLLNLHPTPYSTQTGMVVMMGLHLLLAACGAYFLARSHGLGAPAAGTGALAFAFSSLMVRRVCEYHFITVLAWLPLLLALAKRMTEADALREKAKWSLLTGLFFGISTLGGSVQIVNYMALCIGCFVLLNSILYPAQTGETLGRRIVRGTARNIPFLALVFVLGGLIAAALLVPAAELAGFGARQQGEKVGQYSDLLHKGPMALIQDGLVYAGMKYESEALRNSGIIALMLAIAGLTYRRFRTVALYLVLYLVLLDCSLGPPMPIARIVSRLTPFSLSVYSRAYDVALLPLSMLAALGTESFLALPRRRWTAAIRAVAIAILGGCAAWALDRWLATGNYLDVSKTVVVLPVAGCAVLLAGACGPRARWICALLPLLVFAETLAWNAHFVPWLARKPFTEPADKFLAPPRFPQDNSRGADHMANRELFGLATMMTGYDPLHLQRVRAFISGPPRSASYHRVVDDVESTADNERGNLLLKRLIWLAPAWTDAPTPDKAGLFPPTTAAFLSSAPGLDIPKVPGPLPQHAVSETTVRAPVDAPGLLDVPIRGGTQYSKNIQFEIPAALEGATPGPAGAVHSALYLHYTSTCRGSIEIRFYDLDGHRAIWGRRLAIHNSREQENVFEVALPDYKRVRATVTAKPSGAGNLTFTQAYILNDQKDEDGRIASIERGANATEVELRDLPGPHILTYLDADYPGWRVSIDGQPAPLLRAFDVFKAVAVPAGTHRVRFEFRPTRVYAGMAISITALAATLAALLYLFRRQGASQKT